MGKKNGTGWNLCLCHFLLFVIHEKCQIEIIDLNNKVKFYHQVQPSVLLRDEAICHPFVLGQIGCLGEQKKGYFEILVGR